MTESELEGIYKLNVDFSTAMDGKGDRPQMDLRLDLKDAKLKLQYGILTLEPFPSNTKFRLHGEAIEVMPIVPNQMYNILESGTKDSPAPRLFKLGFAGKDIVWPVADSDGIKRGRKLVFTKSEG